VSDPSQLPDGLASLIGGGVVAGGGGLFWAWIRGVFSAREKAAEEFRIEMRADLKEVKALVQALVTTSQVAEQKHHALELRVAALERAVEQIREGGR
jgi:hypothetical protein